MALTPEEQRELEDLRARAASDPWDMPLFEPEEEDDDIGFLSNVMRGGAERFVQLGSHLGGALEDARQGVTEAIGGDLRIGYNIRGEDSGFDVGIFTPEEVEQQGNVFKAIEESLDDPDLGYEQRYTLERMKEDPSFSTVAGFGMETLGTSMADIAAMLISMPAYFTARENEMAEERAAADNREVPTFEDYVTVAPGNAISAFSDRWSFFKVLGKGEADKVAKEAVDKIAKQSVAKEAIKKVPKKIATEAATEGLIQEPAEYLSTHLGTETGVDADTMSDVMLGGAVGGAFGGGVLGGPASYLTEAKRKREAQDLLNARNEAEANRKLEEEQARLDAILAESQAKQREAGKQRGEAMVQADIERRAAATGPERTGYDPITGAPTPEKPSPLSTIGGEGRRTERTPTAPTTPSKPSGLFTPAPTQQSPLSTIGGQGIAGERTPTGTSIMQPGGILAPQPKGPSGAVSSALGVPSTTITEEGQQALKEAGEARTVPPAQKVSVTPAPTITSGVPGSGRSRKKISKKGKKTDEKTVEDAVKDFKDAEKTQPKKTPALTPEEKKESAKRRAEQRKTATRIQKKVFAAQNKVEKAAKKAAANPTAENIANAEEEQANFEQVAREAKAEQLEAEQYAAASFGGKLAIDNQKWLDSKGIDVYDPDNPVLINDPNVFGEFFVQDVNLEEGEVTIRFYTPRDGYGKPEVVPVRMLKKKVVKQKAKDVEADEVMDEADVSHLDKTPVAPARQPGVWDEPVKTEKELEREAMLAEQRASLAEVEAEEQAEKARVAAEKKAADKKAADDAYKALQEELKEIEESGEFAEETSLPTEPTTAEERKAEADAKAAAEETDKKVEKTEEKVDKLTEAVADLAAANKPRKRITLARLLSKFADDYARQETIAENTDSEYEMNNEQAALWFKLDEEGTQETASINTSLDEKRVEQQLKGFENAMKNEPDFNALFDAVQTSNYKILQRAEDINNEGVPYPEAVRQAAREETTVPTIEDATETEQVHGAYRTTGRDSLLNFIDNNVEDSIVKEPNAETFTQGSVEQGLVWHHTDNPTEGTEGLRDPLTGFHRFMGEGGTPFAHVGTKKVAKDLFDGAAYKNKPLYHYPLWVDIKKPLWIRDYGDDTSKITISNTDEEGLTKLSVLAGAIDKEDAAKITTWPQLQAAIRGAGYDGWGYKNSVEDKGATSYITLESSQLKSSVDNIGDYNRRRVGIRQQIEGEVAPETEQQMNRMLANLVARGSSLREALSYLADNTDRTEYQILANRLLEILPEDATVEQYDSLSSPENVTQGVLEGGSAIFDPNTGKIYIDEMTSDYAESLLHEVIHAVTYNIIEADITTLPPEVQEALENFHNNYLEIFSLLSSADNLSARTRQLIDGEQLTDPHEFLTYALTDKNVQEDLKNIQMPTTNQSLWSMFVDFMSKLLNVPKNSALERALNVAEEVFNIAPTSAIAGEGVLKQQVASDVSGTNEPTVTAKAADSDAGTPWTATDVSTQATEVGRSLRAVGLGYLPQKDLLNRLRKLGVDALDRMKLVTDRTRGEAFAAIERAEEEVLDPVLQLKKDNPKEYAAVVDMMEEATINNIDYKRKGKFKLLSTQAQDVYKTVEAFYKKQGQDYVAALEKQLSDIDATDVAKAEIQKNIEKIKSKMASSVYFPLQRFGNHRIDAVTPDGKRYVSFMDTVSEMVHEENKLRDKGFTEIKTGTVKDVAVHSNVDIDSSIIANAENLIESMGGNDDAKRALYQTLMHLFPAQGIKDRMRQRKNVLGSDKNLDRSVATSMNLEHDIARRKYSGERGKMLADAQQQIDDMPNTGEEAIRAKARAQQTMDEVILRENLAGKPRHEIAQQLTKTNFFLNLGWNISSALVNLTQNAIVGLPVLGSKYGFTKASVELGKAMQQTTMALGEGRRFLQGAELAMFKELQELGAITETQAAMITDIARGRTGKSSGMWDKTVNWSAIPFQRAEMVNRLSAAIATYRLATNEGKDHATAVQEAYEAVDEIHFDYSEEGKSRMQRGNIGSVALAFKSYPMYMISYMGKNFVQQFKGASPTVRKEAAKKFWGTMVMTNMFAGSMGLPLSNVVFLLSDAMQDLFGEDEEWDAHLAFNEWAEETFGEEAGQIFTKGLVGSMLDIDLSSRTSLTDMVFRIPAGGGEPADWANAAIESGIGPVGARIKSIPRGLELMSDGKAWQGMEAFAPKFYSSFSKAARWTSEGAAYDNYDRLMQDEYDGVEGLKTAFGFTTEEYKKTSDKYWAKRRVEDEARDEKRILLRKMALASVKKDRESRREIRAAIREFNKGRKRDERITNSSIKRAIKEMKDKRSGDYD